MEIIDHSSQTIPVLVWMAVSGSALIAGLTTIGLMIMQIRLSPRIFRVRAIRKMKQHDILAEVVRSTAQIFALIAGISYMTGHLDAYGISWVLIIMNMTLGFNSINELVFVLGHLHGPLVDE